MLHEALERHAFLEMDAVLHDEMLVAGMKDVRVDRRNDLNSEIVGADDAHLQT